MPKKKKRPKYQRCQICGKRRPLACDILAPTNGELRRLRVCAECDPGGIDDALLLAKRRGQRVVSQAIKLGQPPTVG
jgi:ribosomal protein L28